MAQAHLEVTTLLSRQKRDGGLSLLSLGMDGNPALPLSTWLKLIKGFGYLLWPLLRVVQFPELKLLTCKTKKNLFQKLKRKPFLGHFPLSGSSNGLAAHSEQTWPYRNPSMNLEWGTYFPQLSSSSQILHTAQQHCFLRSAIVSLYTSAKAPGDTRVTLRTCGDLRMCSWSLYLFSEKKTSKTIFAVPLGLWLTYHQPSKILLCYFHMLK